MMFRKFLDLFLGGRKRPARPTSIPVDIDPNAPMHQIVDQVIKSMPPPPEPRYSQDDLREMIIETETSAIAMARGYPPDPTRRSTSFMGGLPQLPDDVRWPVVPGTDKPLTFLAQLDCATLPLTKGHPDLPRTGSLWFFADPALNRYFQGNTKDTQETHVIYRDLDANLFPERAPPDGPPWWESDWGEISNFPNFGPISLDGRNDVLPTVLAKWPLEFALMRSYRNDWNREVSIYDDGETEKPDLSGSSDLPRLKRITFTSGEWDGLELAHAELLRDAWYDAFGLNEASSDRWHRSRPWYRRNETPLTWLALRKFCVETAQRLNAQIDRPDTAPETVRIARQGIETLRTWLTEADAHPTYGVVASDRRDAFVAALMSMENPGDQVASLQQVSMALQLNKAIHGVLSKQIWHSDCGIDGFDSVAIDCESWKHRPFTRINHYGRDNLDGPPDSFQFRTIFHRLMGAPETIKNNDPASDGYIMLAEFSYDYGIDLKIGDLNSLTYWIKPQALEARDFSNVLVIAGPGTVSYDLDRFKPGNDAYAK